MFSVLSTNRANTLKVPILIWLPTSDLSPKMETPSLSPPANHLELQILLTTTSGRYIFRYPTVETNSASMSLLTTLSAAFTAFMHTTHSTVRTIQTRQRTLNMISSLPLLLTITTPTDTPTPSLAPFARLILSAVYTTTSRSLHDYLLSNPTASTRKIASLVGPLLRKVVTSFSQHPLPVHLSLSPALRLPIDAPTRLMLQNTMQQIVKPKLDLTHSLLLLKSSYGAGMGEVLAEVFREGMKPSWLDHAFLSCADEDLLFLPTTGFHIGLRVRRRTLKSVSASRVEVRPPKLGIYTLLVLGTWSSDDSAYAESVLDDLQGMLSDLETLDGMHANHRTDPIMDHVRRAAAPAYASLAGLPENDLLEALFMLGHTRCIGTDRAFDALIATPIVKALFLARTRGEKVAYVSDGVRVLVEDARYVIVFKDTVPHEKAQDSARQVVKWLQRFDQSLLLCNAGACIPHNTPLAGFLTPFWS